MVTIGPFTLNQHDQDSRYVLKPNPHYYGGVSKLDQAVGEVIVDDDEALKRYESGNLDFLTSPPQRAQAQAKAFPYLRTWYLGFNTSAFPMSNPHFRRAVALSLSPKRIQALIKSHALVPGSFVPPGMPGFDESLGLSADPAEAKKELRLSGVAATGLRSVELLVSNSPHNLVVAETIQGALKETLGLSVTLLALDQSKYAMQRSLKSSALFLSSWIADFPDPDNFVSIFMSDAGNNHTNWKSASYDERVTTARNATSRAEKDRYYKAAQVQLLSQDVVIRPLYYDVNRALIRPGVQGLEVTPLNHVFFGKVRKSP
jgi:oligopeptide transport system substrate-binding protein